jgi:hypothetical protein
MYSGLVIGLYLLTSIVQQRYKFNLDLDGNGWSSVSTLAITTRIMYANAPFLLYSAFHKVVEREQVNLHYQTAGL